MYFPTLPKYPGGPEEPRKPGVQPSDRASWIAAGIIVLALLLLLGWLAYEVIQYLMSLPFAIPMIA